MGIRPDDRMGCDYQVKALEIQETRKERNEEIRVIGGIRDRSGSSV